MRFSIKIIVLGIIGILIFSGIYSAAWSISPIFTSRDLRQQPEVNITVFNATAEEIDASDAVNVAIDTNVTTDFNQRINTSTVPLNITLKARGLDDPAPGVFTFYETVDNETIVVFTPDDNLTKATTYDFTIASYVKNETGSSVYPAGYMISFTTIPLDNGTITGYINDSVTHAGLEGVKVSVLDEDNNVLAWTMSDLNGSYSISVYPGVNYTVYADGTEVHYYTGSEFPVNVSEAELLENVNVSLIEKLQKVTVTVNTMEGYRLADGATNVLLTTDIEIIFNLNYEVDPESLRENLTLKSNETIIPGSLETANNKTFIFDPAENLTENTEYELIMNRDVQPVNTSQEFPLWRNLSWRFSTRVDPIVAVFPEPDAYGVPVDTSIYVWFSIDINETSKEAFSVTDSKTKLIAGNKSYDSTLRRLSFDPEEDLAGNEVYTVRLDDTIEDPNGTKIFPGKDYPQGGYIWSFTTESTHGALNIFVTDMDGNTLPGATVTVMQDDQQIDSRFADDQGKVTTELMEGFYNITATLVGYLDGSITNLELEAGTVVNRTIQLRSETGEITGIVRDKDGNPIANVTVKATSEGVTKGSVKTDANGRYSIGNLMPGSYNLTTTLEGYGDLTIENIVVSSGTQTPKDISIEKTAEPGDTDDDGDDNQLMIWLVVIIVIIIILIIAGLAVTRRTPAGEEVEAIEEGGYRGGGVPIATARETRGAMPSPTSYRELEARGGGLGGEPAKPRYYGRCPVCMHQVIGTDECFHCAIRATYDVQDPPYFYE